MKKLFLALIALFTVSLSGQAQISLADAYSSLAELPGMSAKSTPDCVKIDGLAAIRDAKVSAVRTGNIGAMRNQFFYMIESLPMREVVISANNQRELATVFAEPAGNGVYNLLVLKGNALTGEFSATYGQIDKSGVDAISSCELTLEPDALVMTPTAPDSSEFISMTR